MCMRHANGDVVSHQNGPAGPLVNTILSFIRSSSTIDVYGTGAIMLITSYIDCPGQSVHVVVSSGRRKSRWPNATPMLGLTVPRLSSPNSSFA